MLKTQNCRLAADCRLCGYFSDPVGLGIGRAHAISTTTSSLEGMIHTQARGGTPYGASMIAGPQGELQPTGNGQVLRQLVSLNGGRLNRNWVQGTRIAVTQEQLHVLQEYFCMLILSSVTRIGVYD